MMKKILIGLFAMLGVAFLGLVTYSFFDFSQSEDLDRLLFIEGSSQFLSASDRITMEEAPKLGYLAPTFSLPDLDGQVHALSDFRGKPVLINFWATWCPSCRSEMKALQAFYERQQGNIQVLGVNWGETSNAIAKFLTGLNVTFPNLLDKRGTAFVSYQLTGVPTSLFLDEAGAIRGIWLGPMETDELEAGFARFLAEGDL